MCVCVCVWVCVCLYVYNCINVCVHVRVYIRSPMGFEHPGKGIYAYHSDNVKLFE